MPPRKMLIPAAVTLALMVAMRFVSFAPAEAADAAAYHEHVRDTAFSIPQQLGPWSSHDIDIPAAAVTLLKPNVMLGRNYRNEETGRSFALMLVQCGDARDMEGHYPPNCYPGNGWEVLGEEPFTITAGQRRVDGQTYHFERSLRGLPQQLTVMNVIMLPNGAFGQGMAEVRRLAGTYRDRFYGAGQLQFVFSGEWPEDERRAVAGYFLSHLEAVMDAIMRPPASTESGLDAAVTTEPVPAENNE